MEALSRHVIEWLPEFALDTAERRDIGHHNCVQLLGKAAASVYTSEKYQKRGEFGEILLHIILRQDCASTPAISKVYFKSAANDTVKGFDAVHIVGPPGNLELWLGESKFYNEIGSAIADVSKEMEAHSKEDYLRGEFIWIGNKLSPDEPHFEEVKELIHRNVSLDKVFKRLCFPVLLTYDSDCIGTASAVTAEFQIAFDKEVRHYYQSFKQKTDALGLRIHLFLLPLKTKSDFVQELDRRLKACQIL